MILVEVSSDIQSATYCVPSIPMMEPLEGTNLLINRYGQTWARPCQWLRLMLLCGVLLMPINALADKLSAFTTDGCSMFPNGTLHNKNLWAHCCIAHDLAYWLGGTEAQREAADAELRTCVSTLGEPRIAQLMYEGVRAGGSAFLPTTYRWGYGWDFLRGYKPLNTSEKQLAAKMLTDTQKIITLFHKRLENPAGHTNASDNAKPID